MCSSLVESKQAGAPPNPFGAFVGHLSSGLREKFGFRVWGDGYQPLIIDVQNTLRGGCRAGRESFSYIIDQRKKGIVISQYQGGRHVFPGAGAGVEQR